MTTFTIDEQNNITAVGSVEEAATATTRPFDTFTSQKELTELAAHWPAERLVAIWNSLPGVTPAESFKSNRAAISRIWTRIQRLGAPAQPQHEQPVKAKRKAKGGQGEGDSARQPGQERAQGPEKGRWHRP